MKLSSPVAEMDEPLGTSEQVAEFLGTTVGGLAQLRYLGRGPEFVKLGHRTVRYRWSDVRAYVAASVVSTGSGSRSDSEPAA